MWGTLAVAILFVFSVPALAFVILFRYFPHHLVKASFITRRYLAGMKIKFVGDENFVFCYGEKNAPRPDKASVLFIHGFSSSKDQWITCFKGLPKNLHLIAVDMPGHGGSSVPGENVRLGIEYAVTALDKFVELVGLNDRKFHLVGSSLGGAIAGLYTSHHPERVERLTMVCPAMLTPVDSEFSLQVKAAIALGVDNITPAHCKLLPTDVATMKELFEICCYTNNKMKFSDQIWKGFIHLRLPKTSFYLRLFKAVTSPENLDLLQRISSKIRVPTQLIWGEQDKVIHVSGAEVLKSKLTDCRRVDFIDQCGHAIDMDRPGAFNKFLLQFIQEDITTSSRDKKSS